MVFTLFFQHVKNKIYHKRNEHAKHPWYSVFFPLQVQKLKFNVCIKKRLKHCNLQCFRLLPRTKQRYVRCFLTLGAPKSSQNIGIYDVFATPKKTHVAKTPLFATLWQDNMSEMLYFTVFLNHLFKKLVFTVFLENTCIKHRK